RGPIPNRLTYDTTRTKNIGLRRSPGKPCSSFIETLRMFRLPGGSCRPARVHSVMGMSTTAHQSRSHGTVALSLVIAKPRVVGAKSRAHTGSAKGRMLG